MKNKDLVGVVIVSYNSKNIMKSCIESVTKSIISSKNTPYIVVVDNNSKDSSAEYCMKIADKVIANKKNYGFAYAVNQGLKEIIRKNTKYILILNPDVITHKDAITEVIKTLDSSPEIGACGPSMLNENNENASSGYYLKTPSLASVALFSTYLRKFSINNKWLVNKIYEENLLDGKSLVDQIPGAFIFSSEDKLKRIGLMDEDFAIWFEDVEWSFRAKKLGYKLAYCPEAKIYHEGGVTFSKWNSPEKAITFYVSMKTFFRKNKPLQTPFVLICLSINAIFVGIKNSDRNQLLFIKRIWTQKKGILPN